MTYWLNRRLCSASTVCVSLVGMQNTTPSGCACHQFPASYNHDPQLCKTPPRQAAPATNFLLRITMTPSYAKHHPVRLRLPPLHRRGISGAMLFQQPSVSVLVISPPQEENYLVQIRRRRAALFCPYGSHNLKAQGGSFVLNGTLRR